MILQTHLPYDMSPKPLPGIAPLDPDDWIMVDDAFAAQVLDVFDGWIADGTVTR